MKKEQKKFETWTKWEEEQLERYGGEVFVSNVMNPIPWHCENSRRYNIYNNEDLDITVDVELREKEGEYEVVEL